MSGAIRGGFGKAHSLTWALAVGSPGNSRTEGSGWQTAGINHRCVQKAKSGLAVHSDLAHEEEGRGKDGDEGGGREILTIELQDSCA